MAVDNYPPSMHTFWQYLTRWAVDCPLYVTFNPGATEAAIAADSRASLQIHNDKEQR